MSFADDIRRFVIKVQAKTPAIALSVATKAHASIKGDGTASPHPITGAPGQPVSTGFLRNSWILTPGRAEHTISSNVAYAPVIEYNDRNAYDKRGRTTDAFGVTGGNIGPAQFVEGGSTRAPKSVVGGHGSVRATIAAKDALQAEALRELAD